MTAKEFLLQYRLLDVQINCKLEQIARLREQATKYYDGKMPWAERK